MQNLQYEYLVCLALENTEEHPNDNTRFIKSPSVFKFDSTNCKHHIIELAWCFYSTANKNVTQEYHYYVKPKDTAIINDQVLKRVSVDREKIEQACSFEEVMKKFYETLFNHSSSACVVVEGDWVIMGQLAYEASEYSIVMPHIFNSYINIFDSYEQFSSVKCTNLEQIAKGLYLTRN